MSAGAEAATSRAEALGQGLRERRTELKLSLRELARRVGCSAALLSQIENGRVTPSMTTLYAIVNELSVSVDGLFAADHRSGTPRERWPRESELVQRADGRRRLDLTSGVQWQHLTPAPDDQVDFLLVVYQPGAESCEPDNLLRHTGKEYGFVVEGELGVTVGGRHHELREGDAIAFDSTVPHRLWAIGDEPARAVWVVLGRQHDVRLIGPRR